MLTNNKKSLLLVSALYCCNIVNGTLYTADVKKQKELFNKFKSDYSKVYETKEEEEKRFNNFVFHLKEIDELTANEEANGGGAQFGITSKCDLTYEEFFGKEEEQEEVEEQKLNTSLRGLGAARGGADRGSGSCAPDASWNQDWVGSLVSPNVLDMQACVRCGWAAAAAEQIASDVARGRSATIEQVGGFSSQRFLDCVDVGWRGGKPKKAYEYARDQGGVDSVSSYPFVSTNGYGHACSSNPPSSALTSAVVTDIHSELKDDEECMAEYVQQTGPISVCLKFGYSYFHYTGGILSNCGGWATRCMQVVGVLPNTDSTVGYWRLKNYFGTGFGESGYMRIAYGGGKCEITKNPMYTTATSNRLQA